MAFKITIPFYSVQFNFYDNNAIVPLTEHSFIRIDQGSNRIAQHFTRAFQKKILNKGLYNSILDHFHEADYEKSAITIDFPAAKNHISYGDFDVTFEYYYKPTEKGFWAVVPVLGLESYAADLEELQTNLEQTIKLEFARNKRLNLVQHIVDSIWFDDIKLLKNDIELEFHTLSELDQMKEKKKEEILPKVAERLRFNKRIVFGRHKELDQIARALKGKFNKSIILVGASGVGKTALIWEIIRQRIKFNLKADVYETTASTLIKELTQETGWQDNLVYLCRELSKKGDILFIRNLLELFEVGQYEGNSVSMAEYIRTFISRGEITVISECTEEEFARIELKSPNYAALFQVIRIVEPKDELEDIIIKKTNQTAHSEGISIEQEAIKETIRLNRRYTPYSGFPGKPIRFLESILLNHKITARQRNSTTYEPSSQLDKSAVIAHFCEETGMPPFMVDPTVDMNVIDIRRFFFDNIFGQDEAVHSIVDLLASVKTALTRQGKPIASFLFVGPTGVGKTEMAKVLAQFMFGSRERMIRFDMSEFSNPYSVQRLTGLSYFEDGLLTSAVRREPFCVLLFDEIEKAHPLFYDLLLQMLGEGRLTDSRGKLVNFCSTIIIMTSNIGAAKLQNNRLGWKKEIDTASITEHFMSSVRKHFRPELFNRIDQVIPFEPLTKDVIRFVVDREIVLFKKREGIKYRKMDFYINDAVFDHLGEVGYDIKYGARRLQRALRDELIIPLAHQLNNFEFDDQLVVNVTFEDAKIAVTIEADPLKLDLLLEELEQHEFADHTSELRRNINQLQEGRFFIGLLSDLDIMERSKKKNEIKFWANKQYALKYGNYLKTKQASKELTDEIEAIEMDLALVCMDMKRYQATIKEDIKIWETQYFDLKVELFNRINPQSKKANFGIYGKSVNRFLGLYLTIFDDKDFKYEALALWYRESYFSELVERKIPYTDELTGTAQTRIEKVPRAEYVIEIHDFEKNQKLKPPQKGDRFIGFEFDIKGNCPFLYLQNESDFHSWKMENKEAELIWIYCSEGTYITPNTLHRKIFWDKKKPRRIISDNHIQDSQFKLKREVNKNQVTELLINALDKAFLKRLDEELM